MGNDGGPAFPMPIAGCNDGGVYNTLQQSSGELGGMTLRDYFAAKAMQGFCANPAVFAANPNSGWALVNCSEGELGDHCYRMADAMLAARAEDQP